MATVYRIAKWTETYERSETRKLKTLHWVSMPVAFSSAGYNAMLDAFDDDAPAIYGAWSALVAFAASCNVRGTLADSRGNPLTLRHIARVTGFPVAIFERLIEWAAREDVAWLELVAAEDLTAPPIQNQQICSADNSSGESPDDLPPHRGDPPSTRQDITGQDITKQDKTISRSFDWANVGRHFWDSVREIAIQMADMSSRGKLRGLDRDDIWRMAWVANELDRPGLLNALARIRTDDVKKTKGYLGTVMMRMCESHGCNWDEIKLTVPPTPPPSRPAPTNHHGGNHATETTEATVAAS